jgi:hypothetical protein
MPLSTARVPKIVNQLRHCAGAAMLARQKHRAKPGINGTLMESFP